MNDTLINYKSSTPTHKYSEIVLESQFEELFNAITELAATQCNTPISLIAFVDNENIWIHSKIGLPQKTTKPIRNRFCKVIPKNENFFEICDTDLDIAHKSHLLSFDSIHTKYYAGAKIHLPLGEVIGALCVFDVHKRKISNRQRNLLLGLAKIIEKSLVTKTFFKVLS